MGRSLSPPPFLRKPCSENMLLVKSWKFKVIIRIFLELKIWVFEIQFQWQALKALLVAFIRLLHSEVWAIQNWNMFGFIQIYLVYKLSLLWASPSDSGFRTYPVSTNEVLFFAKSLIINQIRLFQQIWLLDFSVRRWYFRIYFLKVCFSKVYLSKKNSSENVVSQSVFSQSVFPQSVFLHRVFFQSVFFQSLFSQSVFLAKYTWLVCLFSFQVYS